MNTVLPIPQILLQAESEDDNVSLKILQTLLLIIGSPHSLARVEETALSQALGLCFRLHAGTNPIIANTATATLRQVELLSIVTICMTVTVSSASADGGQVVSVLYDRMRPELPAATVIGTNRPNGPNGPISTTGSNPHQARHVMRRSPCRALDVSRALPPGADTDDVAFVTPQVWNVQVCL